MIGPGSGRDFGDKVHQIRVRPDLNLTLRHVVGADKTFDPVNVIVVEMGVDDGANTLGRKAGADVCQRAAGVVFLRHGIDQNEPFGRVYDGDVGDVVADQCVRQRAGLNDLCALIARCVGSEVGVNLWQWRLCGFLRLVGSCLDQPHGGRDPKSANAAVDLVLCTFDPATGV